MINTMNSTMNLSEQSVGNIINVLNIFPHVINKKSNKLLYGCIVPYGKNIVSLKLPRRLTNSEYIIVNDKIRGPIKYFIINNESKRELFEIFNQYNIIISPYKNFIEYYDVCYSLQNNGKMITVAEFLFEENIQDMKLFTKIPYISPYKMDLFSLNTELSITDNNNNLSFHNKLYPENNTINLSKQSLDKELLSNILVKDNTMILSKQSLDKELLSSILVKDNTYTHINEYEIINSMYTFIDKLD